MANFKCGKCSNIFPDVGIVLMLKGLKERVCKKCYIEERRKNGTK